MENGKNTTDLNVVIKTLMERWKKSGSYSTKRILNIVPYTRKGKQLCIVVTESNGGYFSARVHYGKKIFEKEYDSNNIDAFMRYILDDDDSFFDELIEGAKSDIDKGIFDSSL